MARHSSWPPPMVPITVLSNTAIQVPASRGTEPWVWVTVTSTAVLWVSSLCKWAIKSAVLMAINMCRPHCFFVGKAETMLLQRGCGATLAPSAVP